MNTRCYMIIIKGEIKTSEVSSCLYNNTTQKWDVRFNNGKTYSYAFSNVEELTEPRELSPEGYRIKRAGRDLFNIKEIYVFKGEYENYWNICFEDGSEKAYRQNDLDIVESCLNQGHAAAVFNYLKELAELSDIKNEETDEKLLAKRFENISFVGNDIALAKYLNPTKLQPGSSSREYIPIFPFGCNNSQYRAVKNAMENQISIIQGPPGTGKTQTILNLIANILLQGKTVQIVSSNNSATENVYEKLSSPEYNLGFIAAVLGNAKNKKSFLEQQKVSYPDFSSWKTEGNTDALKKKIFEQSKQLKKVFDKQEKLALLKQEYSQLVTEQEYFNQYAEKTGLGADSLELRKKLSSKQLMTLWNECQLVSEEKMPMGFLFKIISMFKYGIKKLNFFMLKTSEIITIIQAKYYVARREELFAEIEAIENSLNGYDSDLLESLCSQSMVLLKDSLAKKYENKGVRESFDEESLWKKPYSVLGEYPVILSTAFSSRNSLSPKISYDYLIMDEASQVDITTGALAMSCAKNVVIVGDVKQLTNIVDGSLKYRAKTIFNKYHLNEGYQYTKSFLQSVLEVMPDVTQTLLREHYRCHPKIINFCNQKFYNGELIIMTKDRGEKDVLSVIKTVVGNHERDHYSQRQIDIIKKEIMPEYDFDLKETGIIAPYNNQVDALNREIADVDISTVHLFQGREKDNIIISTVDDEISDFVDDPYLINVAVSRAKKRLMLVVTGNEQHRERNITDLVNYINYNNFKVVESRVNSVFDYLYKQYDKQRREFLKKHKMVSEFDSENLMYSLIEEIISDNKYSCFDVVFRFSLNNLIKAPELLNEQELKYVMNPSTHIDFLIYSRFDKKPVLAIEVDGYEYHKEDTAQASRDALKNHIMELCEVPLLRLKTNGSGEKEKILERLDSFIR